MNNNTKAKAVIDIGSNSIKLTIGQLNENGHINILLDTSEIVQIGKRFINGCISNEKMKQTTDVITRMVKNTCDKGAAFPYFVGTMAMRQALNANAFRIFVYEALKLDIRILSGTEDNSHG